MSETQTDEAEGLVQHFAELTKQEQEALRGKPQAVLDFIDEYSEKVGLMTVGGKKGKIIFDEITKRNPVVMIELGCFVGYSAIYFAQGLSKDLNAKYYSFEVNEKYADIAQKFIDLAGLTDKIEIIRGKASQTLEDFQTNLNKKFGSYTPIDFIFIDHWKDLYVPDLRVLETLSLISPGTVIAADNIYHPGVPDYVDYVNFSPEEKRQFNYDNENVEGKRFLGRWNILYETKTVEVQLGGGRSDAVEITHCTDYLNG